jgi:hypothetical protein
MKIIYENSQVKQTMCWHTTHRRDISNCTEYLIFCIYIFLSYNHPENCSALVLYALYICVYMCICFYSGLSCDVRDCLCVLCIICLYNKCKKWQQTCFCCWYNLWLLQGTRCVLLYRYRVPLFEQELHTLPPVLDKHV